MKNQRKKVSIVIPALNEEEGIEKTIRSIPKEKLISMGYDVEVIVVDGGSKDRTREIASSLGAKVIIESRKGYGRAYKTGFKEASGDIIVTGDADGTYPFELIPELIRILEEEKLDFINTNRFEKMEKGSMSLLHKIGNKILTWTLRILFKIKIEDSQSGMWVFRKELLKKLNLTGDGMEFSEEIKIEAFMKGYAKEIGIPYKKRTGEKKLNSFRDGFRNLVFLFKKWWNIRRSSR
ncbi:MAG: glycosyltransferase family 2 protein [Thermoplasmata archaeon]|nr:MAG: glycosyltransferase family 2 protein [Thermoplasmata archaeon]